MTSGELLKYRNGLPMPKLTTLRGTISIWSDKASLRRDGAPGRQKAAASDQAQQRLKKVPRKPGRSQTSIVRLSCGDLGRLALKDGLLGGRYGNRPGLHRLWDHPQEVDLQKPVVQARALDLDMVGELELTFEIPLGNALVDQVTLLLTAALLVAADRYHVLF